MIGLVCAHTREVFAKAARADRAATELRSLLSEYAGDDVQMGYGDASSYEDSFGRLFVAFANPLRLDAASQMDSSAAGYSATRMLGAAMASCRPRIWIVPQGEPFSMRSYYRDARSGVALVGGDRAGGGAGARANAGRGDRGDGGGVFDDPFRDAFARRYELVETRSVYRVFRCRERR